MMSTVQSVWLIIINSATGGSRAIAEDSLFSADYVVNWASKRPAGSKHPTGSRDSEVKQIKQQEKFL